MCRIFCLACNVHVRQSVFLTYVIFMIFQARTHQLLIHNRELLEHINALVGRLQELETSVSGSVMNNNFSPPQVGRHREHDLIRGTFYSMLNV